MYSSADWRALCNINAKQAARRLADRQSGTGRDTDRLHADVVIPSLHQQHLSTQITS